MKGGHDLLGKAGRMKGWRDHHDPIHILMLTLIQLSYSFKLFIVSERGGNQAHVFFLLFESMIWFIIDSDPSLSSFIFLDWLFYTISLFYCESLLYYSDTVHWDHWCQQKELITLLACLIFRIRYSCIPQKALVHLQSRRSCLVPKIIDHGEGVWK